MFVDIVKIEVVSGKGGNGMVAFRREKYVAKGGPAGGNGGHGGSIIFKADEGLSTLLDLRYNKIIKAKNGENGMAKSCHGKNAEDTIIRVPLGTTVYNESNNKVIGDLTKNNQTLKVCSGGRGGRGNKAFVTSRNTAPEISENGEPGKVIKLRVELKVLADCGLVGFPSVGKSTLISAVSKARPKIADYHFTTLQPNLGMVMVNDGRSFVMADLPGLIEGASTGVGLGHQFLRHIERCRVILHVIDMSGLEGRDPYDDFLKIQKELEDYKLRLLERPMIIVANKMDMESSIENLDNFKKKLDKDIPIIPISAYSRTNIDELLYKTADLIEQTDEFLLYQDEDFDEVVEYNFTKDEMEFDIYLDEERNIFVVTGEKLYQVFAMTNFAHDQSVRRFSKLLRAMGVDEALRSKGVKNGDTVNIFDYEFEFID